MRCRSLDGSSVTRPGIVIEDRPCRADRNLFVVNHQIAPTEYSEYLCSTVIIRQVSTFMVTQHKVYYFIHLPRYLLHRIDYTISRRFSRVKLHIAARGGQ